MKKIHIKRSHKFIIGFWLLIIGINLYSHHQTKNIVNYLNSFEASDHCMVTMADGESIRIDGDDWQAILEAEKYFDIIEQGKNIFMDQELDKLMTLELYREEEKLSTIEVLHIRSHADKIKKLDDLANEHEEFRVYHYYEMVKDMKIVTIANGTYYIGLHNFLEALFEEIDVFMD